MVLISTRSFGLILSTWVLQFFLSAIYVSASPVSNSTAHLTKRFRGDVAGRDPKFLEAPNVSDYPDTLDIRDSVRPNLGNTFVFWTQVPNREGSDRARQFAQQIRATYIYNAYPLNYM